MGKIAMIIAPENFRDEELSIPREKFLNAGFEVDVYSTKKGIAKGMLGMTCNVEKDLSELNVDEYDAIVFVGGSGTPLVRNDERALEIAKEAYEKGKVVGAICWAPTTLAKAGILKGKKATVWVGFDPEYNLTTSEVIEKFGATFVEESVVVDGRVVTANGPRAAEEFANAILKLLSENYAN